MKLAVVLPAEVFTDAGAVSKGESHAIATTLPPATAGFDNVTAQVPVAF